MQTTMTAWELECSIGSLPAAYGLHEKNYLGHDLGVHIVILFMQNL